MSQETIYWFIGSCHVRFLDDIAASVDTSNPLPRCPIPVTMPSALANYSRSRHLSWQVHRSTRLLHAVDLYVSATYCEPANGLEDGCQVAAWSEWKLFSYIIATLSPRSLQYRTLRRLLRSLRNECEIWDVSQRLGLHGRASVPGRGIPKRSHIRPSSWLWSRHSGTSGVCFWKHGLEKFAGTRSNEDSFFEVVGLYHTCFCHAGLLHDRSSP